MLKICVNGFLTSLPPIWQTSLLVLKRFNYAPVFEVALIVIYAAWVSPGKINAMENCAHCNWGLTTLSGQFNVWFIVLLSHFVHTQGRVRGGKGGSTDLQLSLKYGSVEREREKRERREREERRIEKKKMEKKGIDPFTSRMLSARSTIWATSPLWIDHKNWWFVTIFKFWGSAVFYC